MADIIFMPLKKTLGTTLRNSALSQLHIHCVVRFLLTPRIFISGSAQDINLDLDLGLDLVYFRAQDIGLTCGEPYKDSELQYRIRFK